MQKRKTCAAAPQKQDAQQLRAEFAVLLGGLVVRAFRGGIVQLCGGQRSLEVGDTRVQGVLIPMILGLDREIAMSAL